MQKDFTLSTPAALRFAHDVTRVAGRILGRVQLAFTVAAERRQLASLDDRLLKDIGLSRSTAYREFSRDFLDLPSKRIR
jgi:hypothetical protein